MAANFNIVQYGSVVAVGTAIVSAASAASVDDDCLPSFSVHDSFGVCLADF